MNFALLGHLWLTYIPNETGITRATSEIPVKKKRKIKAMYHVEIHNRGTGTMWGGWGFKASLQRMFLVCAPQSTFACPSCTCPFAFL